MNGFKDMRNAAELLLAPKKPLSRALAGLSGLKLNIGGVSLPGVITHPSQLVGPLRAVLTGTLAAKTATVALSKSLTSVLTAFDTQAAKLKSGAFIPPDPLTAKADASSAADFLSFSSLPAGSAIPASFHAQINQRKAQLQQLQKKLSSVLSPNASQGVSVTENTSPTNNPQPEHVDKPDVPALAQGGNAGLNDPVIKDKVKFAVQGVTVGTGKPNSWSRTKVANFNPTVGQGFKDRHNGSTWSEPATAYAAQFPYNHVTQTESGHVIELDDTPGAERVHIFHRAGSFIEFHPDGSVVYKCLKNGYRVTMADENVKVAGNVNVAVDGDSTLYVKGDVHMQAEGDFNVQSKGDFNVFATNINMRAKAQAKLDGQIVDLRYISLPYSIMPVSFGMSPVGFAPRVNMSAVGADTGLASSLPTPSMDHAAGAPVPTFPQTPPDPTPENPLSNHTVYTAKTPAAVAYRARLLDTPEEASDVSLYSAHTGLQASLGDVQSANRQLGGTLSTIDTGIVAPTAKPTVNFLNYDDFKGTYDYADDHALGGTTFKLGDVTDLSLHPNVVADATPAVEGDFEDVPADTTNLTGAQAAQQLDPTQIADELAAQQAGLPF